MMTTYLVFNNDTGKITMCADVQSMEEQCRRFERDAIPYKVEKHIVTTVNGMPVMDPPPQISVIKEWEPSEAQKAQKKTKPSSNENPKMRFDIRYIDGVIVKNLDQIKTAMDREHDRRDKGCFMLGDNKYMYMIMFTNVDLNGAKETLGVYAAVVIMEKSPQKYFDTSYIIKRSANDSDFYIYMQELTAQSNDMTEQAYEKFDELLKMAADEYKNKNGRYPISFSPEQSKEAKIKAYWEEHPEEKEELEAQKKKATETIEQTAEKIDQLRKTLEEIAKQKAELGKETNRFQEEIDTLDEIQRSIGNLTDENDEEEIKDILDKLSELNLLEVEPQIKSRIEDIEKEIEVKTKEYSQLEVSITDLEKKVRAIAEAKEELTYKEKFYSEKRKEIDTAFSIEDIERFERVLINDSIINSDEKYKVSSELGIQKAQAEDDKSILENKEKREKEKQIDNKSKIEQAQREISGLEEQEKKNSLRSQQKTKSEESLQDVEKQRRDADVQLSNLGVFKLKEKKYLKERIAMLKQKAEQLTIDAKREREALLKDIESKKNNILELIRKNKEQIEISTQEIESSVISVDVIEQKLNKAKANINALEEEIAQERKSHVQSTLDKHIKDIQLGITGKEKEEAEIKQDIIEKRALMNNCQESILSYKAEVDGLRREFIKEKQPELMVTIDMKKTEIKTNLQSAARDLEDLNGRSAPIEVEISGCEGTIKVCQEKLATIEKELTMPR